MWVRPGEELRERHSGGTTEEGTIPSSSSSPWTLDPCAGSGSIGLLCDFTLMVRRAQDPGLSAARVRRAGMIRASLRGLKGARPLLATEAKIVQGRPKLRDLAQHFD